MSLAQIKPRSNVIPVRVRLMNETPMTEYCRTVRRCWVDAVKRMEDAPSGSDEREILAHIADAAEELYRDAQFCQAEDMEDIMARRIKHENWCHHARQDEVRRQALDEMRKYAHQAANASGPDAGSVIANARAGYLAAFNFASKLIGEKSNGMMQEVPLVD